jgi:DNA-binding CsgD family transcriptional regulator
MMHNTVDISFSGTIASGLHSWASALGVSGSKPFPFRQLLEAFGDSSVGIAICNRQLRFVAVNRGLAEINKIPPDEHPGRFVSDLVGSLGSIVSNRLTSVFSTGRSLCKAQLIGQLGANPQPGHWIETIFPILDDRNRVKQVGVFVLSVSGLRLRKDISALTPKSVSSSSPYGPNPQQSDPKVLSPRETDVLRLLASGKTTKEAAAHLGISPKTAETYRSKLMIKLNLHSLAALVHYAIGHQLVELQH